MFMIKNARKLCVTFIICTFLPFNTVYGFENNFTFPNYFKIVPKESPEENTTEDTMGSAEGDAKEETKENAGEITEPSNYYIKHPTLIKIDNVLERYPFTQILNARHIVEYPQKQLCENLFYHKELYVNKYSYNIEASPDEISNILNEYALLLIEDNFRRIVDFQNSAQFNIYLKDDLIVCISGNEKNIDIIAVTKIDDYMNRQVGKYITSQRKFVNEIKIPVLLYHHILADDENINNKKNGAVLSLEDFESQMAYLYENGFYTITSSELYSYLYEGKPLPEKSVFIHFDDGYLSNLERAYPVLKKYNFKATIFMIASYVLEEKQLYNPTLSSIISKEALMSNKHLDVFEFASHTNNMHKTNDKNITGLVSGEKADVIEDINKSFELLNNHISLAYPLGQYNKNTISYLEEAGIKMAFTTKEGYVDKNSKPMELNRFIIFQNTPIEKFIHIVNKR